MSARALIIWRGHGDDPGIYSSEAGPNGFLATAMMHGSASRFGIAAARVPRAMGYGFVAAWRGHASDNRIWTARVDTGTSWTRQSNPAGVPRTEDRPALSGFGDSVAMAWRGAEGDEHIWFSARVNAPQQAAANGIASSTHGPALTDLGDGRLLMAWKGSGGNQHLYWALFDGASWSEPQVGPGSSSHGPALASSGQGSAVMVWKGAGNDELLWKATFHGNGWSQQSQAVGRSSHGPALANVPPGMIMVWKGSGGDERLFWSRDLRAQYEVAAGYTSADTPAVTYVDFLFL